MAESIPLSKANTSFTLALFKKLCDADKSANIFYSPFSISSALAMVMLGARGNTAAQMSEVLCFAEPKKQPEAEEQLQQQQSIAVPPHLLKKGDDGVHAKFAELLRELNKPDAAYSLSVANRLYGEKSYQIVENYLSETKKYYHAELESVDFKTSHEPARVKINDWVKDKTQGKIQDLLPEGVVDSLTRLVLVNAIYFKGKWNHQFKESQTVDAEFRINKDEKKTVKMMKQTNDFPFTSIPEINCKILELPYVGKELSMLIFLPDETEDGSAGLERLERELTYDKFVEWTRPDRMGEAEVVVSLPRFKMEEKYDLNEVLISMGMVDAFDAQKSNLSGMSAANDLVVSKVVHKSYVDVNEEGTEAAAATGVVITLLCYIPPVIFNADHPFLFFIRHNSSSSILFAGRYCSPN